MAGLMMCYSHPEDIDAMDEDSDDDVPPGVPKLPRHLVNGDR